MRGCLVIAHIIRNDTKQAINEMNNSRGIIEHCKESPKSHEIEDCIRLHKILNSSERVNLFLV